MAQYPIKMLKDENGTPFVPLVAPEAVKDTQGTDWQTLLNRKLEKTNIIAGQNVTITTEGNDITINSAAGGASANVIDNLDQTTGGVGVLDAHQGHVLKEMIPDVVNNLTTVDTTKALSAYQGYLLNNRVVPGGGATGQVLKKKSATDNDLEWGDAASAVGDALPIGTLSPFVGLVAPKGYLICMGQLVDKAEYPELWELCGNTFGQSTTTQFYLPDLRGVTIAGYKQGDSTFGTLGALIGGLTHTHTVPGVKHSHSISHTHGVPGVAHTHTINSHYHWLPTFDYGQGMGVLDTSRLHKRTTGITPPQDAGNWWFQKSGDTGVTSGGAQWGTADSGTLTSNSTTPSATTTNSQSTTTSGETTPSSAVSEAGSSIQPTVVMNWIIKASMVAVIESNIEDSLTSTSSTDALSAKQGKVLNDKITSLEAKKKVLRIKRSGAIEWTGMSTPQTMPYNVIDYNSSDGALTHYNSNSIKIGAGVSQIRVTAQITTDYPSSDNVSFYQFIYLYKNNTQVFKTISPIFRWIDFGIYGVVLDVTEGDVITCRISTNYTGVYQLAPNYNQFGDGATDYMQVEILK